MYWPRNNRRRSLNTHAAQISCESLETRQLLSADALIADCAGEQNDRQSAEDGSSSEAGSLERTEAHDVPCDGQIMGADSEGHVDPVLTQASDTVDGKRDQETNASGQAAASNSDVQDQVTDLLEQLRRLQDEQIAVEVRFIAVSDSFFEQVGIDFDFSMDESLGDTPNDAGRGCNRNVLGGVLQNAGDEESSGDGFGDNDLTNLDYVFSGGLTQRAEADFGSFDPQVGSQFGLAILSDIEAFFLLQASQGDERANFVSAPKVTLFNGQFATVNDSVQRPFVTSIKPVVG